MKVNIFAAIASFAVLLNAAAHAELVDASYSGRIQANNQNVALPQVGPLASTGTISDLGATLTVGSSPTPFISITSSADGNDYIISGEAHYYYSVNGPGSGPVDIIAHVVMTTTQDQDLASATVGIGAFNSGFSEGLGAPPGFTFSQTYDQLIHLKAMPGEAYEVSLGAFTEGGSASVYVDPYFYIDPAFAIANAGYSLSFSSNASNDVAGAVPEISTWAMLIIGFASIGATTFRRRKSAALAI